MFIHLVPPLSRVISQDLQTTPDGTQAVFPLTADKEDCAGAVEFWRQGFSLFNGLPPAFTSTTSPYTNPLSVSFVSLFNPNADAVVDCAVMTYTEAAEEEEEEEEQEEKQQQAESGGPASRSAAKAEEKPTEEKPTEEKPKEEESKEKESKEEKPKEEAADTKDEKAADKKEDEAAKTRRLAAVQRYSLLCLTKPVALTENARPFS